MKNNYKHITQLEVYELLDKAIATSDEAIFYAQLKHLLDRRKEEGLTFNDHKRFILPPRKVWRQTIRKIKKLPKEVE